MIITGTTIRNSDIRVNISPIDEILQISYDISQYVAGNYLIDLSGNDNYGKLMTDNVYPSIIPDHGGGLFFTDSEYISTNHNLDYDFTITMAVQITGNNTPPFTLWSNETVVGALGYAAAFTDANIHSFIVLDPQGEHVLEAVVPNITEPKVFDFTKLGTVYSIYVNGILISQEDFGMTPTPNDTGIYFSARHNADGSPGVVFGTEMSIFDIKVRNIAYDANQVGLYFNSVKSRYGL